MNTTTEKRAPAKRGKQAMPVKTTLNLLMKEKSEFSPGKVIPAVLVIIVLAALFGKFAVADRYTRLLEAENELAEKQDWLDGLEMSYADYDEVKDQYGHYTYKGFDNTIADRQEILDLLESDIFPHSETQSVSVTGNVFSTTLTGLTLDEVSTMMARLEANPLVESVTVSTAGYNEDGSIGEEAGIRPYATMTIVFTNNKGGEE